MKKTRGEKVCHPSASHVSTGQDGLPFATLLLGPILSPMPLLLGVGVVTQVTHGFCGLLALQFAALLPNVRSGSCQQEENASGVQVRKAVLETLSTQESNAFIAMRN